MGKVKNMANFRSAKYYVSRSASVPFPNDARRLVAILFAEAQLVSQLYYMIWGISETYQTPSQVLAGIVSAAALGNLEGETRTRAVIYEIEKFEWGKLKLLSCTVLFGASFKRWLNLLSVNPTIFLINHIIYLFPRSPFLYKVWIALYTSSTSFLRFRRDQACPRPSALRQRLVT